MHVYINVNLKKRNKTTTKKHYKFQTTAFSRFFDVFPYVPPFLLYHKGEQRSHVTSKTQLSFQRLGKKGGVRSELSIFLSSVMFIELILSTISNQDNSSATQTVINVSDPLPHSATLQEDFCYLFGKKKKFTAGSLKSKQRNRKKSLLCFSIRE